MWLADFREHELALPGPTPFQVEHVAYLHGRTYVFARLLSRKTFSLHPAARLGGAPVDPFLEIPRKLDAAGRQVLDSILIQIARPRLYLIVSR